MNEVEATEATGSTEVCPTGGGAAEGGRAFLPH